jgi:hypothetical protein
MLLAINILDIWFTMKIKDLTCADFIKYRVSTKFCVACVADLFLKSRAVKDYM